MTDFSKNVIASVKKIPKGKVATYAQIAALAGKPHASRGVSWVLNSSSKLYKLPWHRVINSQGKISFSPLTHNFRMQKKALEKEGVRFLTINQIDLKKFQWKKKSKTPKKAFGF